MIKRVFLLLLMIMALLFTSGCFNLRIESDVDYPTGLFKKTMAKIERIHARDPHRKGPVSMINFLIYVGEERKLIGFSVPKDVAKSSIKEGCSIGKDELKKYVGDQDLDIDIEGLEDFERLGPGLLAEIEVAEDNVHMLVWLD